MIYHGYRYPYSYVPQEPIPTGIAIPHIDNITFRMSSAEALGAKTVIDVEETLPYYQNIALCMATDDKEDLSRREKVFSVDTEVFEPVSGMAEQKDKVWEQQEKPMLVLSGAKHCMYYKILYPVSEEVLQEEFVNSSLIYYADINADENIAIACHVQGIPVVAVYRNGEKMRRSHGEHDYGDACNFLDAVFV